MIANLLFTIPAAASRSLFAEGSRFKYDLWPGIREALRFAFVLLIPAIALIIVLAGPLLSFFGGGYSAGGSLLLRVLALSGVFTGIGTIYTGILRVKKRLKELELIFVFKAVSVLAGSYFIIPITGIAGIGYVWLATQGILGIYVLFAMRSFYQAKPPV